MKQSSRLLEKRRTQINILNEEARMAGLAEQDHPETLQDAGLHDHKIIR